MFFPPIFSIHTKLLNFCLKLLNFSGTIIISIFPLHDCSPQFLILTIHIANVGLELTDFPINLHLIFVGDKVLNFSNFHCQTLILLVTLPENLGQSFNLLILNGDFIFILSHFSC